MRVKTHDCDSLISNLTLSCGQPNIDEKQHNNHIFIAFVYSDKMRARKANDGLSVHAISGTHCVLLGLDVIGYGPKPDSNDLSAMLSGMALGVEVATRFVGAVPIDLDTEATTRFVGTVPIDLDTEVATRSVKVPIDSTRRARAAADINVRNPSSGIFVGFAIDRQDQITKQILSLNAGGKPIQKFHYGDYTALPGRQYVYTVGRMIKSSGSDDSPSQFVVDGSPVALTVSTEDPTEGTHGVYFNRGAAGSKAYSDKFGQFRKYHTVHHLGKPEWRSIINPRTIPDPEKSKEARAWLSRGLEEALLQFIAQASGREHRLLACVYEFTHEETILAFASAIERGVDVKIIRHCKGTFRTREDESGKIVKDWIPDSTTEEATTSINAVGFNNMKTAQIWQNDTFIERRHSAGLMHNKFIILMKNEKPVSLWTGSINFTDSGKYKHRCVSE